MDALTPRWFGYLSMEFCEQAVRIARVSQWLKGEAAPVSKVLCMPPHWFALETAQNKLTIRFAVRILD